MKFFVKTADEAAKAGNSSKSRRYGRIIKQYQQAVKSTKAGRSVNVNDLPTLPIFAPIPGYLFLIAFIEIHAFYCLYLLYLKF